jgi:hypothetical protein
MLTRRAANPAVSTARRNPTVRDFRDRIRPCSGLLTHRPYLMSGCHCGEYPAKSRQGVRPWQVAGLWVDVCKRRLFRLPREGVPTCFGKSTCSADGVRGCPRINAYLLRWVATNTGGSEHAGKPTERGTESPSGIPVSSRTGPGLPRYRKSGDQDDQSSLNREVYVRICETRVRFPRTTRPRSATKATHPAHH